MIWDMPETDLVRYYAQRAPEYEAVYAKPERQADLAALHNFVRSTFTGKDVLEVACGTGYWTETLAESAASIFATDINEEVLEIARSKPRIQANPHVHFARADAYNLDGAPLLSACLIAFWWSHIPKQRIAEFLNTAHSKLLPGATVVVIDNRYVGDSSTPISRTDSRGNTFQLRKLADDSTHEVIKNFTTKAELIAAVSSFAAQVEFTELQYYWTLRYSLR